MHSTKSKQVIYHLCSPSLRIILNVLLQIPKRKRDDSDEEQEQVAEEVAETSPKTEQDVFANVTDVVRSKSLEEITAR